MKEVLLCLYGLTGVGIIYYAIRINVCLKRNLDWLEKYSESSKKIIENPPSFVILLPVFNEKGNVENALIKLSDLNYCGKYNLYIITTEKEVYHHNGIKEGTTIEEVEEILASNQYMFSHIHYPKREGNKASQLNYAINQLRSKYEGQQENTCFVVYDIDSMPSNNILLNAACTMQFNKKLYEIEPIALQQPSNFCQGIENNSLYVALEAICQTRWSIGYEITEEKASIMKTQHDASYAYCVGHGMFINGEFLWKYGGFTEPSEDVQMGFRLNLLGIPIFPIPCLDTAKVPDSFKNIILQSGRWFVNIFLLQKELLYTKNIKKIDPIRKSVILLKNIIDFFSWIVHLTHCITSVLLVVLYHLYILLLLSILICYLDYGIGILLMIAEGKSVIPQLQRISKYKTIKLILLSPVRGLIRGVAPIIAVYNFFTGNDYRYSRKGK